MRRPRIACGAAALALAVALLAAGRAGAAPPRLDGEPRFDIGLAWDADTLVLQPAEPMPLSWREPGGRERTTRTGETLRIRVSGAQAIVEPLSRSRAVPLTELQSGDTLWVGEEDPARGDAGRLSLIHI